MAKKYCVKIVYIIHTQQYWPDPTSSDIVFSQRIIHLWGLHEDIQGGVEMSSLSNFNYSRWPPWTQNSSENASVMMDSTL